MTNDELKTLFVYEPETGMLRKIAQCRKPYPWREATGARGGYLKTSFNRKTYYLHRLVWQYHFGTVPEMIDHADGNVRNNRIENLRACTNQQNQYNRKRNAGTRSGVKGVVFHKNNLSRPWFASITHNGARISLGYYATKDEAREAYRQGAERIASEYARAD